MVQMIAQVSIGKSSNIFANYELADKFQDFTLGGKLSNISLSVYPRGINDTDNFWFDSNNIRQGILLCNACCRKA